MEEEKGTLKENSKTNVCRMHSVRGYVYFLIEKNLIF